MRAGGFREVGLQAEAVHRRGLFLAAVRRAEGVDGLRLQLAAHALLVAAEVQVARHLGVVLEVDAVVLYGIGQRAGALQPDAAADALEVQRLVSLHHAQHLVHVVFGVLVVVHRRLQHRRHAVRLPPRDDDVPHALRHAVHRDVAVLVDHVVAIVKGQHPVRRVLVYHVGVQNLRVAEVGVVCPYKVNVGSRTVRAKLDVCRDGLVHAVRSRPLNASRHDAVDIQVNHFRVQFLVVRRAVCALGEAHEGHLVHLAGGHLHGQPALAPRGHPRLLRRDDEARALGVYATDDSRLLVHHFADLVLHDEGHGVGDVLLGLLEGAELNGSPRRVGQPQGVARPPVAAPFEALEHGFDAVVSPFLLVRVVVAPPLGRQLQR